MEKRKHGNQTDITSFFSKKSRSEINDAQPSDNATVEQCQSPDQSQPESATSLRPHECSVINDVQPSLPNKTTETCVGDSQSQYTDVGLIDRSNIPDATIIHLIKKQFRPDSNFNFPVRQHKCKNLKFKLSWLDDFSWLAYSKSENGGYCLPCVLFARKPTGRGCHFGVLVERPFTDFRKALGKDGVLQNHDSHDFHKSVVVAYAERRRIEENPKGGVDIQLDKQRHDIWEKNKTALGSIIDCILYLGRQGLALRGHRDDATAAPGANKGNLQELIQFRSKTDELLASYLKSCPANATYVSKTTQNEVLEILSDIIREAITSNITYEQCPFYSIIADELTDDIANTHILSICIRYLEYNKGEFVNIQEKLIDFTYTERGTAEHLVKVIRAQLVKCGLNPENVRGQSYDTTSAMSSEGRGVQGLFRRDVPNALYTPCNSHKLNLVIASASKLPQIRNCVTAVNDAYLFLKASHKRQGFFEKVIDILNSADANEEHSKQRKLKGLCKTRWVERFEAFDNFVDLSLPVITACDIIVNPHVYRDNETIQALIDEKWNWDSDTKTKAQGILANFGQFETLVSLIILKNVLYPLREITVKLQARDMDIQKAYALIDNVKADVSSMRDEAEERFDIWYSEIQTLATRLGTEERVRRAKGTTSIYRATHPAESTKAYFRRAIAIPLIDEVYTQLTERFSNASVSAVSALMTLIPSVIKTKDISEIPDIVDKLSRYEEDVPRLANLQTELEIWRGRWENHDDSPDSLAAAVKCCSRDLFPNLHVLLQLGCIIPVTSCEAERSFSAVRRTKTTLRSTMGEERLSALVLINSNRGMDIDVKDVVHRFIVKRPRRMFKALHE